MSLGDLDGKGNTSGFGKVEEFAPLLYAIPLGHSAFVKHMENRRGMSLNIIKGKYTVKLSEAVLYQVSTVPH